MKEEVLTKEALALKEDIKQLQRIALAGSNLQQKVLQMALLFEAIRDQKNDLARQEPQPTGKGNSK